MTKMETIIERLKREKTESEKKARQAKKAEEQAKQTGFNAGKESGRKWAEKAHYDELQRFGKHQETDPDNLKLLESYLVRQIQEVHGKSLTWSKGWLKGVQEFWDEIEDKLSE